MLHGRVTSHERDVVVPPDDASPPRQLTAAELKTIDEVANAVAINCSLRAQPAADLRQEAPGIIFLKWKHYDPARPLAGWVFLVLKNYVRDEWRRADARQRLVKRVVQQLEASPPVQLPISDDAEVWREFSAADLERLANIAPRPRFVALCKTQMWRKVPPAVWNEWSSQQVSTQPFPDEAFCSSSSEEQTKRLCRELKCTESALRVAYWRGLEKFREELEFCKPPAEDLE